MEQKALKLIMAGLLILSMALTGREAAEYVGAMHAVNALRETGMGADDSGRLCVPSGVTEVEKKAVEDATYQAVRQ